MEFVVTWSVYGNERSANGLDREQVIPRRHVQPDAGRGVAGRLAVADDQRVAGRVAERQPQAAGTGTECLGGQVGVVLDHDAVGHLPGTRPRASPDTSAGWPSVGARTTAAELVTTRLDSSVRASMPSSRGRKWNGLGRGGAEIASSSMLSRRKHEVCHRSLVGWVKPTFFHIDSTRWGTPSPTSPLPSPNPVGDDRQGDERPGDGHPVGWVKPTSLRYGH